ncbi:hypothetical protein [Pontimicrobium sp. MEBiC01747]
MKRLPLLVCTIIMVLSTNTLLSQELPDYILPSPQAYQITKYGDIPVNETAGKISPSIPLYNYKVGGLNLPITLSYGGSGVRVSDLPTWTGNNWSLNAGGVITRVVKDLPDETSMPRFFYDEQDLQTLITYITVYYTCYDQNMLEQFFGLNNFNQNCDNNNPPIIDFLSGYYLDVVTRELITKPDNYDTEADVFNFSFGGYSGSFALDVKITGHQNGIAIKEVTPIVIKNEHDLKIEVLGDFNENSNIEFVITTADGVKYYFGGYTGLHQGATQPSELATEESQFVDRSGGQHTYGKRAKTAFYLTKIENHLGDRIQLEYYTKNQYEVLSYKNQTLSTGVNFATLNLGCSTGVSNGTGNISPLKKTKNIVYNGKYLKRIWSNTGVPDIVFNSNEVTTANQYYRVLKDINFGTKQVDLQYWPSEGNLASSQNKDKFFLTKVAFKGENWSDRLYNYTFEYDDLASVPDLDSFAQDYLGYYNGVTNNTNLLPEKHLKFVEAHMPGLHPAIKERIQFSSLSGVLADRDPYFEYATKGILTKINFPTGGYTAFEYEPVEKKIEYDSKHFQIYSNMGAANPSWSPNSVYEVVSGIGAITVTDPGEEVPASVFQTQNVTFNLTINTLEVGDLGTHADNVLLEVIDFNNRTDIQSQVFAFPNTANDAGNQQNVFSFISNEFTLEQGKNYLFKLKFRNTNDDINASNAATLFSTTPMYVNCSVTYISGVDETDGLGLRIKRVKDYNADNGLVNTKRYYYKKAKNINLAHEDDSQVAVYAPFFLSFSHSQASCTDDFGTSYTQDNYQAILNSNASALNFPGSDAMNFYRHVTVSYGGDNFEQGGVEKQFRVNHNQLSRDFTPNQTTVSVHRYMLQQGFKINTPNYTNTGVNNGTLEKEIVYRNNNDNLYKIKESKYNYNYYIRDTIKNIGGRKMENVNNLFNPTTSLYDLYFGLYSTIAYTPILSSTTEKTYIDERPLIDQNLFYQGWMDDDHDSDGVTNYNDPDYLNPEDYNALSETGQEGYHDSFYRTITTKNTYTYNPEVSKSPIEARSEQSNGKTIKTYTAYPFTPYINAMTDLSTDQRQAYLDLETQNRVAAPIEVKTTVVDTNNNETPLSLNRTLYKNWGTHVSMQKVAASKSGTTNLLEDRIEYISYDAAGNPRELKQTNGEPQLYLWSANRNPILKLINCTHTEYTNAINSSGITINDNITVAQLQTLSNLLPNAQLLKYNYLPNRDVLESIIDARGNKITYEYDEHYRLKYVKDQDGNILSKNEYNYTTQN